MAVVIGRMWNERISQQRLLGNTDFPAASMTAHATLVRLVLNLINQIHE